MQIEIRDITQSKEYFTREILDEELVDEYVELIKGGVALPALLVRPAFHGVVGTYDLLGGFHTYHAHLRAGSAVVEVEICARSPGLESFLEAVKSNSKHGKPLSLKDKRRNLEKILEHGEAWEWSYGYLAGVVGVSDRTVSSVMKNHPTPKFSGMEKTKCIRNGKLHEVTVNQPTGEPLSSVVQSTEQVEPAPSDLTAAEKILDRISENKSNEKLVGGKKREKGAAKHSKIDERVEALSEDERRLVETMREFEQKCQAFVLAFRLLNDGKSKHPKEALKKLLRLVADINACAMSMAESEAPALTQ